MPFSIAACRTVLPFSTVICRPSIVSVTVSITSRMITPVRPTREVAAGRTLIDRIAHSLTGQAVVLTFRVLAIPSLPESGHAGSMPHARVSVSRATWLTAALLLVGTLLVEPPDQSASCGHAPAGRAD